MKNLTYDQICHEHCVYYSLTTFNNIIKKNNLRIIDFTLNEINGGSIEIICAKRNSKHKVSRQKISNVLADFDWEEIGIVTSKDIIFKNITFETDNLLKNYNKGFSTKL